MQLINDRLVLENVIYFYFYLNTYLILSHLNVFKQISVKTFESHL